MNTGRLARQAWSWLGRELDRWSAAGRRAAFWWRDDDAGKACEELDRLLDLSRERRLPLAVAAIPNRVERSLTERLRDRALVAVLQHGYTHENHALPGQRSLELGGSRPPAEVLADLERGRAAMQAEFGDRFEAVLVPPWNRIDASVTRGLANIGFRGISTHRARRRAQPAPGILQVNTHLDPVNWRHGSGFIGTCPALAILVQHLVAKRSGYRDADEPTGILSHHLAQNDATWQFLDELLQFLGSHPAVEFVGADAIWL
jgi:peptidoglycan/xylan/chitin deacetylase (PgdA/CDA1 family)